MQAVSSVGRTDEQHPWKLSKIACSAGAAEGGLAASNNKRVCKRFQQSNARAAFQPHSSRSPSFKSQLLAALASLAVLLTLPACCMCSTESVVTKNRSIYPAVLDRGHVDASGP